VANDLELKIRIRAELDQLRKQMDAVTSDLDKASKGAQTTAKSLDRLQKELDDTGAKGKQAGNNVREGFAGIDGAINRATSAVAGFLTVYAAVSAVKGIANITDDYASLTAQLKLTTDSTEEFTTAQAEVFRIAQATRAPVATVAQTYATLERATDKLGKSQTEILQVLETVNKSIALTPVNAETAAATLVQFGQALGGDFKNGAQEVNSILEQTPGLAIAIADGLGVATSDLKRMGEEGELSAEIVFNALQKVAMQVDEQFSQIPLTVGGAITQLQNDVVQAFGGMDVSPLTDAIGDLRDTLTDPAVVEGLSNLAAGLIRITGVLADAAAGFADLGKNIGYLAASVTGNVSELDELEKKLEDIDKARKRSLLFKPTQFAFMSDAELDAEEEKFKARIEALNREQGFVVKNAEEKKKAADAARAAAAEQATIAAEQARLANEQKKLDEEAAKEVERRNKQIQSTIANLEEQAATYGKTAEQVLRYQLAVQGASDAATERAVGLLRQVEALKAQEKAEKDAADSAKKLAEERKRAEEKLAKDMEDIRIRALQASGQTVEARAAQLSQQYDPVIAQLQAKGDQAGVDLVNSLINVELADARLQELKSKISDSMGELSSTEQSVDARVTTGDLAPEAGSQEIQAARQQAIADLQAYRAELQQLAQTDAPGAAEALAQVEAQIAKISQQDQGGAALAIKNLNAQLVSLEKNMASNAANAGVDAFATALEDIALKGESAEDAMKNMARSFAQSIAQMIIKAIALQAVLAALSAIPGGAAVASALGASGSVLHTGGIVGRGGVRRRVPAFTFAGAPRYHDGGVAGLKPGEVPAILQQGEEVLAKDDPRNAMNGGGGQQQGSSTRIINVIDPDMVQDYMTSSSGEETIINVIQRNSGAVKQVLG
jgi:tape measure domain-containing protein